MPTMNYTLMINKVSNGFVIEMLDDNGESVETAVANLHNTRGYDSSSLASAIEKLYEQADELQATEKAASAKLTAKLKDIQTAWGFARREADAVEAAATEAGKQAAASIKTAVPSDTDTDEDGLPF